MDKKIIGTLVGIILILSVFPIVEGVNKYQNHVTESSLFNNSPEISTLDGFWNRQKFSMFGVVESMGNDSQIKVWFEYAVFSKLNGKKIFPVGDPDDEIHTRNKSDIKLLTTTGFFMIEKNLRGFYFVYFRIQVFAEGLQSGINLSGVEKMIWPDVDFQVHTLKPIVNNDSYGKYYAELKGEINFGGITPRYGYFHYGRYGKEWLIVDKLDVQGNPIPTDPLPQIFSYTTNPGLQNGLWRVIAFVEGTQSNGEVVVLHGYKNYFLI